MPESFGVRLRRRRERQQIGLATVAEQTKIKQSLLEELERDDVSHWPTGIFRRGFVRTYARAIGLEPDVVVREFLELYPDPIEVVETVAPNAPLADAGWVSTGPPTRFQYLVGSVATSLGRVWHRFGGQPKSAIEHTAPSGRSSPKAHPAADPDLVAIARLCTALGRLDEANEAGPFLKEASEILDAVGLIVWVWDPRTSELKPTLSHGYSDTVVAQLPRVKRDTDNATAAAFRSAETCVVNSTDRVSGAVVAPLMTPLGCVGVLAIELQRGHEQRPLVHALVTIFAAQLARLVGVRPAVEADNRRLA
jgi:hypothetical protein